MTEKPKKARQKKIWEKVSYIQEIHGNTTGPVRHHVELFEAMGFKQVGYNTYGPDRAKTTHYGAWQFEIDAEIVKGASNGSKNHFIVRGIKKTSVTEFNVRMTRRDGMQDCIGTVDLVSIRGPQAMLDSKNEVDYWSFHGDYNSYQDQQRKNMFYYADRITEADVRLRVTFSDGVKYWASWKDVVKTDQDVTTSKSSRIVYDQFDTQIKLDMIAVMSYDKNAAIGFVKKIQPHEITVKVITGSKKNWIRGEFTVDPDNIIVFNPDSISEDLAMLMLTKG